MSALYGSLIGARGKVTRTGNDTMICHVRGCNFGVTIEAIHDESGDYFDLYLTKGSNNPSELTCIGSVCNGHFIPDVGQK